MTRYFPPFSCFFPWFFVRYCVTAFRLPPDIHPIHLCYYQSFNRFSLRYAVTERQSLDRQTSSGRYPQVYAAFTILSSLTPTVPLPRPYPRRHGGNSEPIPRIVR